MCKRSNAPAVTKRLRVRRTVLGIAAVAALLTLAGSAGSAPPVFNPGDLLPVGGSALSVALADLNGDGRLDVVTADDGSNTVSVILALGAGGYAPAVSYFAGAYAYSVAVGDLSGDGIPDVVSANLDGNTVSVLRNDGNGVLSAPVQRAVGALPVAVAVADVNGDGQNDLATADFWSNSSTLLLADGAGGFLPAQTLATGTHPRSLAVGDVDGDGHADILTADDADGTVSVLLGSSSGSFSRTSYPIGANPYALALADVNGDGHLDVASAAFGNNEITLALGDGHGAFGAFAAWLVDDGPVSLVVADFNSDGFPDIAAAAYYAHQLSVLTGDGAGGFTSAAGVPVGHNPRGIASGDLDGDGRPDLVSANFGDSTVSIVLNQTDVTAPVLTLPGPIGAVATSVAGAVVSFAATAADPDDAVGPVVCAPASGSTFPLGTTTVHCTAADSNGNSTAGSFTVTVTPPPPTISVPAIVTREATGPLTPVTFTATGDSVPGIVVTTACVPPSGSSFTVGDTSVDCTATSDSGGGSVSASFTVRVRDTTGPALTVPAAVAATAGDAGGAHVTYSAGAQDLVDGTVAITCAPASGALFPVGATTVSCTAIDAHANTGLASFVVHVAAAADPVAALVAAIEPVTGQGGRRLDHLLGELHRDLARNRIRRACDTIDDIVDVSLDGALAGHRPTSAQARTIVVAGYGLAGSLGCPHPPSGDPSAGALALLDLGDQLNRLDGHFAAELTFRLRAVADLVVDGRYGRSCRMLGAIVEQLDNEADRRRPRLPRAELASLRVKGVAARTALAC